MGQLWLLEIAKAIGRFFMNPVFYFSIILVLTAGFMRVKRERSDFNVRVHNGFHELKHLLPAGLLTGMMISIITLGAGLIFPFELIAAVAVITVVLGIVGNARLLSPALTIGLPVLAVFAIQYLPIHIPYLDALAEDPLLLTAIPVFIGLMVFTEGLLILKNGLWDVSPKLRTSRRGLTVGALQVKRLWLLPVFFLLPAGPITSAFEWWPAIQWGTESYSLVLVPFLLGFQQQVQSTLPKETVGRMGKQVVALGILLLASATLSTLYPNIVSPIVVGAAVVGRLWISYMHRVRENNSLYYFTPRNNGAIILDVLPGSPAAKMELKTGEIIQSCNNISVTNKEELFEALLKNRAYCKLEVLDVNGEKRFAQCALYEGDHHELGILFVEKRDKRGPGKAM